jgi:hypothetical protein
MENGNDPCRKEGAVVLANLRHHLRDSDKDEYRAGLG